MHKITIINFIIPYLEIKKNTNKKRVILVFFLIMSAREKDGSEGRPVLTPIIIYWTFNASRISFCTGMFICSFTHLFHIKQLK